MNGPDDQDIIQWQDALRWLERGAEDIRVARVLLREDIATQAAFHLQQSVEKILKALLVAARQDVRKTHDLAALAALVHDHWPVLVPTPFALDHASRWYIASRYPGVEDMLPGTAEVRDALPEVEALFSSVIANAPSALAEEARAIMDRSL